MPQICTDMFSSTEQTRTSNIRRSQNTYKSKVELEYAFSKHMIMHNSVMQRKRLIISDRHSRIYLVITFTTDDARWSLTALKVYAFIDYLLVWILTPTSCWVKVILISTLANGITELIYAYFTNIGAGNRAIHTLINVYKQETNVL